MGLCFLVFEVTDVAALCRVERKVTNGRNQGIDTEGDNPEEEISHRSRRISFGFQRRVVDNQTSDPAQEKREKKPYDVVIHKVTSL